MKSRIFLVALAVIALSSMSFAQILPGAPFARFIQSTTTPLTTNCSANPADAWPDGTALYIIWDRGPNGPSPEDVPVPLSEGYNYNTFGLDAPAGAQPPGLFTSYDDLVGNLWTIYNEELGDYEPYLEMNRYYMVLYCWNGNINWISRQHVVTGSGPGSWNVLWTFSTGSPWAGCTACPPQQTCTNDVHVTIAAGGSSPDHAYGWGTSVCLDLCAGHLTTVHICSPTGGALDPNKLPVFHFAPGCDPAGTDCDEVCDPGMGFVGAPVYNTATGCWDIMIDGQVDGCFCFTFDRFLAASIESFSGVAGDNEVRLSWVTASETNVGHYAVLRNGEVIGTVESLNETSTHTYNYVDATAVNGTTYIYGLRVINADNSVTETTFEVTATPSFGAAIITEYALHQNFPNPFNPTTQIVFDVLNSNDVTLKVYNAAGQEVTTLLSGARHEGGKRYVVNFDAGNLTSGLYFYTVKIGNEFSSTKKMLLVK